MNLSERLSEKEILGRLINFNETNDWSVFNDVPPSQHDRIMYPHMLPEVLVAMKKRYEEME